MREERIANLIAAIGLVNYPQELWEALQAVDIFKLRQMARMIEDILTQHKPL